MDVYRVNFGEWYPSLEEAEAAAEEPFQIIERGEQETPGGDVRRMYITIND